MKKPILSLIIIIFSVSMAYSQDMINLDKAIQEAADYFDKTLNAHTVVVVLNIQSDDQELANYIIDEITNIIVNRGNLIAGKRRNFSG